MTPGELARMLLSGGRRSSFDRLNSIDDLRSAAIRKVPRSIFDYVEGGAEGEVSLSRNTESFDRVEFHPCVLTGATAPSLGRSVLGGNAAFPLVLAPTGFTRMIHHDGEEAVARAASAAGVPYVVSMMSTSTITAVRRAAPGARLWLQLYPMRDRGLTTELLAEAADARYEGVLVTADTPVAGWRVRDVKNGLTIPPQPGLRTLMGGVTRPRWAYQFVRGEPITFANLGTHNRPNSDVMNMAKNIFDPTTTWDDVSHIAEFWNRPLAVKGIQVASDARRAAQAGASAVILSNHGGRQLDRSGSPLALIAQARHECGDGVEILVDSGIRRGADIAVALALGADACLVGRAYLYGLMAGGREGVERSILILRTELERALTLLGCAGVDDLGPDRVTLLAQPDHCPS